MEDAANNRYRTGSVVSGFRVQQSLPSTFRGAEGTDALQGFGRQWLPLLTIFIGTWRAAVPRSRRGKE
jgi:hypothetical protein